MKKVPFKWSADAESAFTHIKSLVAKSDILHHIDYSLPLVVRTDASDKGVGAVLFQVEPITLKPLYILFLSHIFSPVASRWPTVEKEAYAIYWAVVEKLPHILSGQRFIIETDHRNLEQLWKLKSPKISNWWGRLSSNDFIISHISGDSMGLPDTLSLESNVLPSLPISHLILQRRSTNYWTWSITL